LLATSPVHDDVNVALCNANLEDIEQACGRAAHRSSAQVIPLIVEDFT